MKQYLNPPFLIEQRRPIHYVERAIITSKVLKGSYHYKGHVLEFNHSANDAYMAERPHSRSYLMPVSHVLSHYRCRQLTEEEVTMLLISAQ